MICSRELKNAKQAQERVQVLVAENSDLQKKLADAEKTVREITEDKPQKEQEIADVRRQVEQLRQQLAGSQKQNQEFETTVAELRSQLEEAGKQLANAKTTGANPEETARLTKENDMLRAIVMRERQEEARRDQARKLMLAEFDKLQIKSETLNQQIDLLAQPVTKLTPEELALLRQPVVATSDSNPNAMTASFAIAKQGPPDARPAAPAAHAGPERRDDFQAQRAGRTGAARARGEGEFRHAESSARRRSSTRRSWRRARTISTRSPISARFTSAPAASRRRS